MALDPFKIRDHIPDFEASAAEIKRRSAETIATARADRNVAYGPGAKDKIDIYYPVEQPGTLRPVHMFIHGGYWRAFGKDDWAYVADAITGLGAIAAIVDYSLMPAARMGVLVDQVRRATAWLYANAARLGGDPGRLTISGHSAGGHLCAMACERSMDYRVRAALPISGLYDLEPLSRSFLQEEVRFTPDEIERFTPLNHSFNPAVKYDIMVGGAETPPFHTQADAFAARLREQGAQVRRSDIAGEHHMSIVLSLGTPGTEAAKHLAQCIGA